MTKSARPQQPARKSFWTPARIGFTFVVLALLAALGLPSCGQPSDVAKPKATVTTNAPAPSTANQQPVSVRPPLPQSVLDTQLIGLDGQPFKLTDYAGKVVVVNLWATWCGPCRSETPELVAMSQQYKEQGVEFIGLTTKENDPDDELVKQFVSQYKVTYRIGYGTRAFALGLMQGNVRDVIPQSFVITRDNRVIAHMTGFDPNSTPQRLRTAIEQALNYKG